MKGSLRIKILLPVGIIIFIVLGTSTLVHIRDFRRDYLEALNLRFEALAQSIVGHILERERDTMTSLENDSQRDLQRVYAILQVSSIPNSKIYELNKEKGVLFISVIDSAGIIAAHTNPEKWDTPVENQVLRDYLQRHEQLTVLEGTIYHTFIPIIAKDGAYLGTIDIGFPRSIVDEKIQTFIKNSAVLFVVFLFLAFFTVFLFVHISITRPIGLLALSGQQLAEGNLIQIPGQRRDDEIAVLRTAFNRISAYLQDITEVAFRIATGILDSEVRLRSKHDVLGKAVHEMLYYLKQVASVAKNVAEGDLTETVQVRSTEDTFGQTIQTMTEGLRMLIVQIRDSAEQIASTKDTISSLANHDIHIVESVYTSADSMVSTMHEMGASVEEVTHNMDMLSTSVEETSASVAQMTSSIAHIAVNTNQLTYQIRETFEYLEKTMRALEKVVENTDVSKQLSQGTIQDALAGQEAVEQVTRSMETIQETITTAVDSITQFAQRSKDIDTILDVIREITDQTSLLALNASIIAAQAGEHGRGFAVVADEIKNLANGVGASTKDIAAIVQTLQQDTNRVAQSIHEGAEAVKQGMERTQQARQTLEKITSSAQHSSGVVTAIADTLHDLMATGRGVSKAMEKVNDMTADITTATNEQEASTRQIKEAIEHINTMASQIQQATTAQLTGVQHVLNAMQEVTTLIEQNLNSSQQITNATKHLSSQADILTHSVERFKLEA